MKNPELLPSTRRRRFSVFHLFAGELCHTSGESAAAVRSTLAHTRKIKGWPDRDRFEASLVAFLNTAKRGDSMMVANLAAIVRAR